MISAKNEDIRCCRKGYKTYLPMIVTANSSDDLEAPPLNLILQIKFTSLFLFCGSKNDMYDFRSSEHLHLPLEHVLFNLVLKHTHLCLRIFVNVTLFTKNSAVCPIGMIFEEQFSFISCPLCTYELPVSLTIAGSTPECK